MERKYNYFYKITNLINNKFYYGIHKTDNLDDGYMGSGTYLKRSIKKYGIDNFKKEILCYFSTYDEVLKYESEIVNEELVNNKYCYNVRLGGVGGFNHISKEIRQNNMRKMLSILWQDEEYMKNHKIKASSRMKKLHNKGKIKYDTFTGKKHTEESVEKMKLIHKLNQHQKGEKNSQYGTCWINKDGENKKIKKEDLETWLKQSWVKGRKMK